MQSDFNLHSFAGGGSSQSSNQTTTNLTDDDLLTCMIHRQTVPVETESSLISSISEGYSPAITSDSTTFVTRTVTPVTNVESPLLVQSGSAPLIGSAVISGQVPFPQTREESHYGLSSASHMSPGSHFRALSFAVASANWLQQYDAMRQKAEGLMAQNIRLKQEVTNNHHEIGELKRSLDDANNTATEERGARAREKQQLSEKVISYKCRSRKYKNKSQKASRQYKKYKIKSRKLKEERDEKIKQLENFGKVLNEVDLERLKVDFNGKEEKYLREMSTLRERAQKCNAELRESKQLLNEAVDANVALEENFNKLCEEKRIIEENLEKKQRSCDVFKEKLLATHGNYQKKIIELESSQSEGLAELKRKHQVEMEELEKILEESANEEIKRSDGICKNKIDEMAENHRAVIEDLIKNHTAQMIRAKARCRKISAQEKLRVRRSMEREYEKKLADSENSHLKELQSRENAHKHEMLAMIQERDTKHRADLYEIERENKELLESVENRHQQVLDDKADHFREIIGTYRDRYERKLDKKEAEIGERLSQLEDTCDAKLARLAEHHQQQMLELEAKHKAAIAEIEKKAQEQPLRVVQSNADLIESTVQGIGRTSPIVGTDSPGWTWDGDDEHFEDVPDDNYDPDPGGNSDSAPTATASPLQASDQQGNSEEREEHREVMPLEEAMLQGDVDEIAEAEEESHDAILPEFSIPTAEELFGELRAANQGLIHLINNNPDLRSKAKRKAMEKILTAFVDLLNKNEVDIPNFHVLKEKPSSWDWGLVQYAAFCLTDNIRINYPCVFLDFIKADTKEYLYILAALANNRIEKPMKSPDQALQLAQVPPIETFRGEGMCFTPHKDFFIWYENPDKKYLTPLKMLALARILNPCSPEYCSVLAGYFLMIMGKSVDKHESCYISQVDRKKLWKPCERLQLNSHPIPQKVKNQLSCSSWTTRLAIETIVCAGYDIDVFDFLEMDKALKKARECAADDNMENYKSALQSILNCEGRLDYCAAFSRDMKRNGEWRLKAIPGTAVNDSEVSTPRFLLACLYHLGFESMPPKYLQKQKDTVLKLVTTDIWSADEPLKAVVEGILTLKLNSYKSKQHTRFMERLDPFRELYPAVYKMNRTEIEEERKRRNPVVWRDGAVTRADGTIAYNFPDDSEPSVSHSTEGRPPSSTGNKRTRKSQVSQPKAGPARKRRKTTEASNASPEFVVSTRPRRAAAARTWRILDYSSDSESD